MMMLLTGSDDGSSVGAGRGRLSVMTSTVPRVTLAPVASRSFQHLVDVRPPHLNTHLNAALSSLTVNYVRCGLVGRTDPLVSALEEELDGGTGRARDDNRGSSADEVDWTWSTCEHWSCVITDRP